MEQERTGTSSRPPASIASEVVAPSLDSTGRRPVTLDLFCGAGGLVLGLKHALFKTALAVDHWSPATRTLQSNFGEVAVLNADLAELEASDLLREASLSAPPDLIAGGPPCQGFSSAGARRSGDCRNTLVSRFANYIAEIRPRAFLFENVEGFLTAEGGSRVIELLDPVIEAGYRVHLRKVNAANFGVPQLRKRVIGIGTLGDDAPFPEPSHFAFGAPGAHLAGASQELLPAVTVAKALASLPDPGAPTAPDDHTAHSVGPVDLQRIQALSPGQTMRDLPDELQHPSFTRRANRRVMDGTPSDRRGGAPAGLRRLVAGEPSKAITGAAARELIHPSANRPLTLRECARLQTFPDEFHFEGTRSERALLIGNAVPPLLAEALGAELRVWLSAPSCVADGAGAVLSFHPTASTGMSPALASIAEIVRRRYAHPRAIAQEPLWR